MKYTEGPWKISREGNRIEVGDGRGIHICYLYSAAEGDEQDRLRAEADARLIAAAPELMEAIGTLLYHATDSPYYQAYSGPEEKWRRAIMAYKDIEAVQALVSRILDGDSEDDDKEVTA